jgi:hypothetical protein
MVTFTKNWELALFWKKVDQLGTQIFFTFRIEQKFKDCTFNNQLLAEENKTLLA